MASSYSLICCSCGCFTAFAMTRMFYVFSWALLRAPMALPSRESKCISAKIGSIVWNRESRRDGLCVARGDAMKPEPRSGGALLKRVAQFGAKWMISDQRIWKRIRTVECCLSSPAGLFKFAFIFIFIFLEFREHRVSQRNTFSLAKK